MLLKLENGMTFRFIDKGGDVQVYSDYFSSRNERWFSVYTHIDESLKQACTRKAAEYSLEFNSEIFYFN